VSGISDFTLLKGKPITIAGAVFEHRTVPLPPSLLRLVPCGGDPWR
jgi:hypothetical protein